MEAIGRRFRPIGHLVPESLLERYGWSAKVTLYGEPGADFGRWPYPVSVRDQPDLPRVYLAVAERIADTLP